MRKRIFAYGIGRAQKFTLGLMAEQVEPPPFAGEDLSDPTGEGRDHELRSFEPAEMRRWLKLMCRLSGLRPTELARAAGLAPSTVNRFLYGRPKHRLSATTIQKIDQAAAHAYEVRVKMTMGQRAINHDSLPTDAEAAGVPEELMPQMITVVGFVQAGHWRESAEWFDDEQYYVSAPPFREWWSVPMIGLEVRGQSMNRMYPEGTVLICANLIHVDRNPVPGEKVIVQQRDRHGLVEATVKELQLDERGAAWLWPRSTDPTFQQPIRFQGEGKEEDDVIVSALVIASIRRESFEPPQ